MAKFGKLLRTKKIAKWKDNYIDYKALKHFIKENSNPCKSKSLLIILKNSK